MGTKISALTETGSAPTGAYYPLEYENANYKISTETLRANLGGKYTADWATSHGGVDVDNAATLTITHNLGTTDVIVQVFVNSSASDTDAQLVKDLHAAAGSLDFGCTTTSLASNTVTVQLASDGYLDANSSGELTSGTFNLKFIKVVVLSAGTGGTAQKVADSAAQSGSTTVDYKIGDLQGEDQVFISASIRHDHASFSGSGFQINATYGRSDASATKTLCASVNGRIAGQVNGEYSPYIAYEGGAAVEFSNFVAEFSLIAVGDEVFVRVDTTVGSAVAGTVYWSYTASAGAGGGGTNKYIADWATSHGGTTVDDEATLAIGHNLGTTDFNVSYYVNDAATDTNAQIVTWDAYPSVSAGAQTTDVSTTGVTTQLGKNGYVHATSAGQTDFSGWAGKYLKAVFIG